ncbi:unnamed protein product [Rhizophagus irregularis]|nr:unnamed protein product [Rhizophagus irregularis]
MQNYFQFLKSSHPLNIELLTNDLHQAVLLPMDKPRGATILLVVLPHIVQLIWLLGYGTPLVYHQWQKLTTLFIGGISPGVTDDCMEKILKDLWYIKLLKTSSGDDKKVNIKADENTRKYLAQYEASRPGTVNYYTKLDKSALLKT